VAQGFYFSQPLTAADFGELLTRHFNSSGPPASPTPWAQSARSATFDEAATLPG